MRTRTDMTQRLTKRTLRGILLVLSLAMTSCATVGSNGASAPAGQTGGVATSPAASAGRLSVASQPTEATTSRPASSNGEDEKSEGAKIYKGSGVFLKPPEPERPTGEKAEVSVNFEAVDIRDIAKTILADVLGESYLIDPKVQGSITFRATRPLPRSALLPTLETVLRMNGIAMVKENGIFKILPANAVRGSVSPRMGGAFTGYSVQIVPLKFVGAPEMARILEPFAADPANVKVDEMRNLLILAGTQNEIRHMLDTVEMFDVDWLSGMSVGLFTLKSTDVKTLNAELDKIVGDKSLNPLAGVVRFIPIERLNSFIVITPQPHYLEQAKIWLERLDKAGGTGGTQLYVYQVQNGKADHLADLLNQAFGGEATTQTRVTTAPSLAPGLVPTDIRSARTQTGAAATTSSTTTTTRTPIGTARQATTGSTPTMVPRTTSTPTRRTPVATGTATAAGSTLTVTDSAGTTASEVRVVPDVENNALLIIANAAGYEKIVGALKKLDTTPRQVLIEVTIAEVTLTDDLEYGLEWLFTNGPRQSGRLDMGSAGLNARIPGFSWALTSGAGDIRAILNMLATQNKVNVLSSPHVMVADNQTAKIQVGDSVPTAGPQTVSGTGVVVSSVQYLDTGVILNVTPRINAGGLVNLDIDQEVSSADVTTTSGLNSPTIRRRSASTSVAVQSGETMVLGGLMSENSTVDKSGLPVLSQIPILGGLFGTQLHKNSKTELVVLITPRVATNVGQAKLVSDEFRTKMREAETLMKCGTSNVLGVSSRGGLWCLSADAPGSPSLQTETAPTPAGDSHP